jgi:perosamine synthetase
MVLTDDDHLAEECRKLRNLCFEPKRRFVHKRLGWNLRMTNLQAALGLAQLERLDEFIKKKRWIGQMYKEMLADFPGIQLPLTRTDYAENIYWVFGLVLDESLSDAETLMSKLNLVGVGTRPFFCPMHLQPVFREMGLFTDEKHPVSERLYKQGFYLPSGLNMSIETIKKVSQRQLTILKEAKIV